MAAFYKADPSVQRLTFMTPAPPSQPDNSIPPDTSDQVALDTPATARNQDPTSSEPQANRLSTGDKSRPAPCYADKATRLSPSAADKSVPANHPRFADKRPPARATNGEDDKEGGEVDGGEGEENGDEEDDCFGGMGSPIGFFNDIDD
eukprot:scaffold674596_cov48-Prasinocladus_malaysianus.AAC.1